MINREMIDRICNIPYNSFVRPSRDDYSLNTAVSWDAIAKQKDELLETIMNKIMEQIRTKVSEFLYETSKPNRVSTDLFGYDKKKPSIDDLDREIVKFLDGLVKQGIINKFQSDILGIIDGSGMSQVRIGISPYDEKWFSGSVSLDRHYPW